MDKTQMISMYRKMVTIRRFEEKVEYISRYTDKIPGFIHLCIGQEAIAVGACMSLRRDDFITTHHRGDGHLIARDGHLGKMMAELFGKETGYCKGKAFNVHWQAYDVGVLTSTGIVGDTIPIAAGAALAFKLKGTDQVCLCFFGDGASNTGAFHEGINLASVWKLPVVFICENNLYAVSTNIEKSTSTKDLADRAAAYGITGVVVDGMDIFSVYKVVSEAVEKARNGKGPTLIECKTYRFGGHSALDPKDGMMYRPKQEILEWKERCPVQLYRDKLKEMNILTEVEAQEIEREASAQVENAVKFAEESPYPEADKVHEGLYNDSDQTSIIS